MFALVQFLHSAPRRCRVGFPAILTLPILSLTITGSALAPAETPPPAGVAWDVRGQWSIDGVGSPIADGAAILPGSLLVPQGAPSHSITVLLPDGLRILYECFTAEDCARGFRVPALYRRPAPLAVDLLSRVHFESAMESTHDAMVASNSRLPRDETLVVLDSSNHVRIAGLAGQLSNGHYTGELRSLDGDSPRLSHIAFDKSGPAISLPMPGPGVYDLRIADELNSPRIDLFIAAVGPDHAPSLQKPYATVKQLMMEWNTDYQGWPVHDFQRAYLRLFFRRRQPPGDLVPAGTSRIASTDRSPRDESTIAAEPTFSPAPGVFPGKTVVTLRCSTSGAAMRYTDDTSQPRADSHVYSAPIVVEGTELTIKAFCSAPGHKDSPVVTGVFRIHDKDDTD